MTVGLVAAPAELAGAFPSLTSGDLAALCSSTYCPCLSRPRRVWRVFASATLWLCVVQSVLYCLSLVASQGFNWLLVPDSDALLSFGCCARARVLCLRQYWRPATSIFLAASSLQLVCNWAAAAWFLWPMEASWGFLRFVIVYTLAGTVGALASTAHTAAVTTGSSGAVFGIVGGYLTVVGIYWTRIAFTMKRQFLLHLIIMPITYIALSFLPGVDWVGDLAALGAGAATAVAVFGDRAEGWRWKVGFRTGAAVLALVIVVAALYAMTGHADECKLPSE